MRAAGAIFDLDGTLGDTLPVCFAAFRLVFQHHRGLTLTNEEILSRFGPSEEGVIAGLVPDAAEQAIADYLRIYEQEHRRCPRPFPGVRDTLEGLLARGVRLAVVTGKGARTAELSLERFGLGELFERVEAGSAAGAVKPAAMQSILDGWGMSPDEVVSVGDSPSDVRSARSVGIVPVAAAWASTADEQRLRAEQPTALFHHFRELADWLEA